MADLGDKVSDEDKERIEKTITDLREALTGSDVDRIKSLTEQLEQASHALAQQMYSQQAGEEAGQPGNGAGPQAGGPAPEDEDVVEGEFRQV